MKRIAKSLVSILTPCYNTANFVSNLLDSILAQDYPYIEMFAIDDGSTDNTREIIQSYISKFRNRGYKLTYIYQENSGQSVAINNGLKLISGEYLVWPDSDDYYESTSCISKMVEALEKSSNEFAMVRTQEQIIDENSKKVLFINGLNAKVNEESTLFTDCLFSKEGFYFVPGAYMVRTDALREMTGMSIYTEKHAGQNWQIFLPILYKYRCITIKEVLYTVLSRACSHSRGQYNGYEVSLKKFDAYENTIQGTLDNINGIPPKELAFYKKSISIKYLRIKIIYDFLYNQAIYFEEHLSILKNRYKSFTIYDRFLRYSFKIGLNSLPFTRRIVYRIYTRQTNDKFN